jgi:hypothetical protein|eukprot:COSAG06_NODE_3083_length_5882_cov_2.584990_4_plen_111_part_00
MTAAAFRPARGGSTAGAAGAAEAKAVVRQIAVARRRAHNNQHVPFPVEIRRDPRDAQQEQAQHDQCDTGARHLLAQARLARELPGYLVLREAFEQLRVGGCAQAETRGRA